MGCYIWYSEEDSEVQRQALIVCYSRIYFRIFIYFVSCHIHASRRSATGEVFFCAGLTESDGSLEPGLGLDPLEFRGNNSATSNNMTLVHWPLISGMLHLVQLAATARPKLIIIIIIIIIKCKKTAVYTQVNGE